MRPRHLQHLLTVVVVVVEGLHNTHLKRVIATV